MRSQAAPLPTQLTRCAAAYAQGNTQLGDDLFPLVHEEILPLVDQTVCKYIRNTDRHPDVTQEAVLAIWRQLKRGIAPTITLVTYHCCVNNLRMASGMGDSRTLTSDEQRRAEHHLDIDAQTNDDGEFIEAFGNADPSEPLSEAEGVIDAGLIADTLGAVNPIWSIIALQLSEGRSQNAIAASLGITRWAVNKHVISMREHLEAA